MKEQNGHNRRRKKFACLAGGGILLAAVVFPAFCSMTAAGKEKKAWPKENTETGKTASEETGIRIGDRSQRYPVTDEAPKGSGNNWIRLSLLEADGKNNGMPEGKGGKQLTCYIKKQTGSRGGFSSPACSYDVPSNWAYGSYSGEPCLEVVWPRDSETEVCLHITENRLFAEGVGEDWKEMQKKIRDSAKKTEGAEFTDFCFERYRRAADERELLFYSFICRTKENEVQYAVAYVTGERYLAEFIGSCPLQRENGALSAEYAIDEITRYMAASYQETGEEKNFEQLKYRPYLGCENWAYEDLHNPFALAADTYASREDMPLRGADRELHFASEEWEDLLRAVVRHHYDMSDEAWKEFSARPLYARDVAWITEVTMTESPIPGRDTVSVGGLQLRDGVCADYELTTMRDIAVLPNLEKLTLEIGGVSDYHILAECPSLQDVTIVSAEPLKETGWLYELPALKSLTLRISMFAHLQEIGYEKDGKSTFQQGTDKKEGSRPAEGSSTLTADLARCSSLQYLELEQSGMMDFGFLNALPNLYTFRLSGEERDSKAAKNRQAVFKEGTYPQIRCLVVDDDWLRNPA